MTFIPLYLPFTFYFFLHVTYTARTVSAGNEGSNWLIRVCFGCFVLDLSRTSTLSFPANDLLKKEHSRDFPIVPVHLNLK
ncbi:unnamed protein product, partial [Dicrocoelium dendriticum]